MTARIGDEPNMDAYEFIDDGYSRLDHLDGLGHQPDLEAMNLHDRAEYQFQVGMKARYRRHSHFDPVAGVWIQLTAAELADRAFERKWRRLLFALYGALVLAAAVAVVLAILQQNGVLS